MRTILTRSPTACLRAAAFSLAEVVIALGIGATALVAIIGLMPTSLQTTRNTVETTQAALVARMISCDLRASATTGTSASAASNSSSAVYGIPLKTGTTLYLDKLGGAVPLASGSAQYQAQVIVTCPNKPGIFAATDTIAPIAYATILLTWPAAAPIKKADGSLALNNAVGSLEVTSSFTPSPSP